MLLLTASRTASDERHALDVERRAVCRRAFCQSLEAKEQRLAFHARHFTDEQLHARDALRLVFLHRLERDVQNPLGDRHFMHRTSSYAKSAPSGGLPKGGAIFPC